MIAPLSISEMSQGEDHDSADVRGTRRSFSVAEVQQVLRELQARGPRPVAATAPTGRRPSWVAEASAQAWGDTEEDGSDGRHDRSASGSQGRSDVDVLERGWIGVLAGHAGAGASTVALAISDAAAADDRRVHLVDTAQPFRSGLVAAASEELGPDVTGAWRRGLRVGVTIDRRATDIEPGAWPVSPFGDDPALTVVDLGLAAPNDLSRLAVDRGPCVVVCRPTVPGVRLTEQPLNQLAGQPVVVAAVGPTRWPGEVTASQGPRLRALRAAGRVVPVPIDRRLQVTGPTSASLPRTLRMAGRSLLYLLDDSHPAAVAWLSPRNTRSVSISEDTP